MHLCCRPARAAALFRARRLPLVLGAGCAAYQYGGPRCAFAEELAVRRFATGAPPPKEVSARETAARKDSEDRGGAVGRDLETGAQVVVHAKYTEITLRAPRSWRSAVAWSVVLGAWLGSTCVAPLTTLW